MQEYKPKNIEPLKGIGSKEVWKRYKDTYYCVSSEGRFLTTYKDEKLIEPAYHKPTKTYRFQFKKKNYYPARMVWECFVGEIPKGYCVMHKKRYKTFWDVYSLELVPTTKMLKEVANNKNTKFIVNKRTGEIYRSATEASKKLYLHSSYIRNLASGYSKSSYVDLEYIRR